MWDKILEIIVKRLKHPLFYLFSFVSIIIVIFAKNESDILTIIGYIIFELIKRKPERIDEKKKKLTYLREGLKKSIENPEDIINANKVDLSQTRFIVFDKRIIAAVFLVRKEFPTEFELDFLPGDLLGTIKSFLDEFGELEKKSREIDYKVYETVEGYFEEKKHTYLPYHKMCAEYLKRISSGQNIADAKRVIYRYPIEPNESLEEITLKFSKNFETELKDLKSKNQSLLEKLTGLNELTKKF